MKEYEVSNIAIYGNCAYFSHSKKIGKRNVQLVRMCVDSGKADVIYEHEGVTSIEDVKAMKDKVIFYAYYVDGYNCGASGTMILDLVQNKLECLSNPCFFNYLEGGGFPSFGSWDRQRYEEFHKYDRDIFKIDLGMEIFWMESMGYWEPHELFGDRDAVIDYMPIWKKSRNWNGCNHYFDGIYCYDAPYDVVFNAYDRFGEEYCWGNGRRGDCKSFKVLGQYVYLDDDCYVPCKWQYQYRLSHSKSERLRESWFKEELPKDVINAFENR